MKHYLKKKEVEKGRKMASCYKQLKKALIMTQKPEAKQSYFKI